LHNDEYNFGRLSTVRTITDLVGKPIAEDYFSMSNKRMEFNWLEVINQSANANIISPRFLEQPQEEVEAKLTHTAWFWHFPNHSHKAS